MNSLFDFFLETYQNTSTTFILLEVVAFFFGIASVWYAKKENILVYPTGLVATIITVFLLYKAEYFGDMMMNFYYSVMSIYGWWNWSRTKNDTSYLPISRTNFKEKWVGFLLFVLTMIVTYAVYWYFGNEIKIENYIDIFTSGVFFTAMWYMAIKKLENWTLWIIADIITIPLYAYRGLGMLSLQYLIFTILAIQGYIAWKKSLDKNPSTL
ncbi:MAG: nicotinamide mononucleotide transporter [Flavobacteriia bacterium]|nr:nicotinamide mononucleotide transporter [Flavobacteriia bacterium]OIP47926.1 MAG: nicotinamide mononucleotide transporter [Flavobacteriaceae bacterium CG2_30_31_66]PIV95627.1 MAG: nicotinamide mononucleotide transporter [Flavobacteriaceae bacterium CG17_big_fil_post_rev_8_21_14_2_50_31_13]PIX15312.1 MAG: nicotinamide mononucleotide transporter [Flavobacteriaceae bacterium CG_4_8_14_3_um_filter_31_8]PIY16006.1 MAG: nicotinamide mononucleotide transporter [Flavobacteriaceae bacterium CG_4_10_1